MISHLHQKIKEILVYFEVCSCSCCHPEDKQDVLLIKTTGIKNFMKRMVSFD